MNTVGIVVFSHTPNNLLFFQTVIILYVLLWLLENFPILLVTCGILAHLFHYMILDNFPFVSFISPIFIINIGLLIVNHYVAFRYFADVFYSFTEVMAYFTLFLWPVPFALFISISAGDNVLPTTLDNNKLGKIECPCQCCQLGLS